MPRHLVIALSAWISLANLAFAQQQPDVKALARRPAAWWNARWNRRCELTFHGPVAALGDLPVVIRGSQLKRLSAGEPFSVGSLRIVGVQGEIPCQFDERCPNHTLDDEDELVFQVDSVKVGTMACWLYWNTASLPPGRYPSRTLMGDAMEPGVWQHDIQLWNDQVMLGMRGPARGDDPSKNQIENWGSGAVVLLEVLRLPVLRIQNSWGSIFPRGALASSPGPDAAAWDRPRELFRGPVRVAAACNQRGASWKTAGGPPAKVGVEHRVWLYERGAVICFEEQITAREAVTPMQLQYECGLGGGDAAKEQIWYSQGGTPRSFIPTQEQIEQAKRGNALLSQSGIDPWLAAYWPALKKGYAILLDPGGAAGTEVRSASCYVRSGGVLRYKRTVGTLPAGQSLVQRFWVVGLRGEAGPQVPLAAWNVLNAPPVRLGPMEKRGAP